MDGVVCGQPRTALVCRNGTATGHPPWLKAAGLSTGVLGLAAVRDPLVSTLSLSRTCDRLLEVQLFGAGRRSPARTTTFHAMTEATWKPFAIVVTVEGRRHQVRLFGELDLAEAPGLEQRLAEITGSPVEIDLSFLSFLDARGLSVLVGAKRRLARAGGICRLTGAQGVVRRVFALTGNEHLLDD